MEVRRISFSRYCTVSPNCESFPISLLNLHPLLELEGFRSLIPSLSVPGTSSGAYDNTSAELLTYVIFLVDNESSDQTLGELITTLPVFQKDIIYSEGPAEPHDLLSHHMDVCIGRF